VVHETQVAREELSPRLGVARRAVPRPENVDPGLGPRQGNRGQT